MLALINFSLAANSFILAHLHLFVKNFFQGFSTVFLAPIRYAALFRTLAYIIIAIRVCQPLFSLFFILFYISYNLC